jgi:hypothetical protein
MPAKKMRLPRTFFKEVKAEKNNTDGTKIRFEKKSQKNTFDAATLSLLEKINSIKMVYKIKHGKNKKIEPNVY